MALSLEKVILLFMFTCYTTRALRLSHGSFWPIDNIIISTLEVAHKPSHIYTYTHTCTPMHSPAESHTLTFAHPPTRTPVHPLAHLHAPTPAFLYPPHTQLHNYTHKHTCTHTLTCYIHLHTNQIHPSLQLYWSKENNATFAHVRNTFAKPILAFAHTSA